MKGVLNLRRPRDLLKKLDYELRELEKHPANAYAAINAVRDAYHLREWIWHDRLLPDPVLRRRIIGKHASESAWNEWVNTQLGVFQLTRELCNGSKHFIVPKSGDISASHQGGWDTQAWDTLPWDAEGFHVECGDGHVISVNCILIEVHDFWRRLFAKHPQLN